MVTVVWSTVEGRLWRLAEFLTLFWRIFVMNALDHRLEKVRRAFPFEVAKLPLFGPDREPTGYYGLFADDTGTPVRSSSVSRGVRASYDRRRVGLGRGCDIHVSLTLVTRETSPLSLVVATAFHLLHVRSIDRQSLVPRITFGQGSTFEPCTMARPSGPPVATSGMPAATWLRLSLSGPPT